MAVITGTSANDTLADTAANDTINGLAGNDTINAGSGGTDVVDGGDGRDSLLFMTAISPVLVDFGEGVVAGGRPTSDVTFFTNIERAVTGDFNDELRGNAAAQNLTARAGTDTLWGAGGFDTLWGGSGADTFIFREFGSANADNIGDWTSGSDKLLLDATVMTALGASGSFTAGDARFWASSAGTAHDADDRIIYETDTRQVWYDADGNGAGARQLIATLQTGAALVATDIVVEGGTGGGQVINGTSSNDSLVGTAGDDTINGFGGNDTIQGSSGNDRLDGGAGHDSLRGAEGVDTFIGGDGNDTLDGEESLFAENDADVETFDGGLGDDLYIVDNPSDVLTDAGGIDTVRAINMDWTLGAGFENLHLNNDEDEFLAIGIGNELDNFMQGGWFVRLEGRGGNDSILGSPQEDILLGGDGNDTISGGQDPDILDGGAGNDLLTGRDVDEFDADVILFSATPGVANADQITDFLSARDVVRLDGTAHANSGPSGSFTAGDARFAANSTGTAVDSSDRVVYNTSNGQLWYDADGSGAGARQLIATLQGAPTLAATDIEIINGSASGQVINGTSGSDMLSDTAGSDTINGLGGNDTINGGSGGSDVIDGGTGRDSLMFMAATSAVVVNFGTGTVTGGGPGSTSFTNIERMVTGDFNDQLTGNVAAQNLTARAGADTLAGAGGIDTLWGGAGPDTFIFRESGAANADVIGDWTSGSDEVGLDNAAMAALGADGAFVSGDARFWSSTAGTAHDANDRVIYNTSTGQLYYDADGTGSGAAQLIATFTGSPTVAATDISVI